MAGVIPKDFKKAVKEKAKKFLFEKTPGAQKTKELKEKSIKEDEERRRRERKRQEERKRREENKNSSSRRRRMSR